MAGDTLTPSENAILIVLMAEAREVLNTELKEQYQLDVRGPSREKLARLQLVSSRKSGRTYALLLDDKGWVHVQSDLVFRSNGATAQAAALLALQRALRERVLSRSGCRNVAELFALTDVRAQEQAQPPQLEVRLRQAYDALAAQPGAWVSLARLRPFFGDVPRDAVDEALRALGRQPGVALAPESNGKALTATDTAAAVHFGGQDKHLLAIGSA